MMAMSLAVMNILLLPEKEKKKSNLFSDDKLYSLLILISVLQIKKEILNTDY